MADDSFVLLCRTRHKCGHIHQHDQRNVVAVAGPDKTRRLVRCIVIQTSRQDHGLIRHDADALPVNPAVTYHHIFCKILLDLKKTVRVADPGDDLQHIVGFSGIVRHDLCQLMAAV